MTALRIGVIALCMAVIPTVVPAQETGSFDDVQRLLKPDQRVVVTDMGGGTTRGHVVEVTPSAVTIRVDDAFGPRRTRTFERGTVATIRRSDRLWNGFLIGLGAGIIASEVWVYNLCGPRGYDDECAAIATGVGLFTMVPGGAVAGLLIDKAIGNQLIYRAARGRAMFDVAPVISPKGQGVVASIRF